MTQSTSVLVDPQEKAIASLAQAIIDKPEQSNHQIAFADMVKFHAFNQQTHDTPVIKEALQICLNHAHVSSMAFINAWSSLLWLDQDFMALVMPAQEGDVDFDPADMVAPLNDPFLLTGLKYLMVSNVIYERFLAAMRRYFLLRDGYNADDFLPFLCALAEQCSLNEYIYACSDEEKEKLAFLSLENDLAKIAVIGCYKELSELENAESIAALAKTSGNEDFKSLVQTQITEPMEIRAYYDKVPSLSPVQNEVSFAVAKQYEESPYPRWRYIDTPDVPEEQKKRAKGKSILVAGCATGQEPIKMALQYPEAQVLGVDLSVPSIAYAMRKTEQFGIKNLEFMHADILDIDKLDRQFDMIICVGVLHHMEAPLQGWRKLIDCLKPDGVMKIALYSELARQAIVQCGDWIAEKGFEPTREGISNFRQEIMALEKGNPLKGILGAVDFFSLSMCRDLVFHVQEHRFTLPQIKTILDDLDLEIIKMMLHNMKDRDAYRAVFPDDPEIRNLDHLEAYEHKHPDTFRTMYSFWCHKKDGRNTAAMPAWAQTQFEEN